MTDDTLRKQQTERAVARKSNSFYFLDEVLRLLSNALDAPTSINSSDLSFNPPSLSHNRGEKRDLDGKIYRGKV
jgi:hypothetical protein